MKPQPRSRSRRRPSLLFVTALLPVLGLASCGSTYASRGGMIGGALGAGTGAIIGAQSGAAVPGAIIGAGVGLVSGALIGGGLDEVDAKSRARDAHHSHETVVTTAPAPDREPPLTYDDVIRLAQSGVSDYVIIAKIRASRTVFRMTVDDVLVLREAGVGDPVIDEMIRYRPAPRPARTEVITTRRHAHSRYCGCAYW